MACAISHDMHPWLLWLGAIAPPPYHGLWYVKFTRADPSHPGRPGKMPGSALATCLRVRGDRAWTTRLDLRAPSCACPPRRNTRKGDGGSDERPAARKRDTMNPRQPTWPIPYSETCSQWRCNREHVFVATQRVVIAGAWCCPTCKSPNLYLVTPCSD